MKSIKELVMKETRVVYVYTPSKETTRDFLKLVEKEVFCSMMEKDQQRNLWMITTLCIRI